VKAVVDTNVVANLVLGITGFAEEARTCFGAVASPLAPGHWDTEVTNVIWMAMRTGVLSPEEGPVRLGLARRLGIETVPTGTLCQGALLRAARSGVPVYDTLFVELAAHSRCPLVTFDKALLRAFPDIARRPRDLKSQ